VLFNRINFAQEVGYWDTRFGGNNFDNPTYNFVYAIAAVDSDEIYTGGLLNLNGKRRDLVKWNGSGWSPLGRGGIGSVQALKVIENDLYLGGGFAKVDNVIPANNIAKWNGHEWSALSSGVNSQVYALAFCGDDLYV